MAKIVKLSTKRGQQLLATAENYEGYRLTDVYGNPSGAKEAAWDWCFEQFRKDETSENFHICSHNTFSFSVAWTAADGVHLETANNSYLLV